MITYKSKKILIHSNYRPENFGGIELVVKTIIKAIQKNDYEVTCFFGAAENSNIGIDGRLNYISRRILIKIGGACILSWGNLKFLLSSLSSQLVIFQEPYPTLWPALFLIRNVLRKKVIVLVHADPVSNRLISNVYSRIRSLVFNGSICVATSPGLLKRINNKYFEKALIVPLSISNCSFPRVESIDLPKCYALYIGRLAKYKGVEYILECAKLCPDVHFVIAGEGLLSSYVSDFISNNKILNVYFINRFVTEAEKYELIDRSSFILFPSVSENEAFGLVQLEAMKLKKAIVNTWLDSGVNYVAPNDVCAVTVSRKNSAELARAINLLWCHPDWAVKLGQNGFDRFQSLFQEKNFIDSWNTLVAECLDKDSLR